MYLLLKTLHIVAVVVFVGNITVGVFWKLHADRSRDPRLIAHALAGIGAADRALTQPSATLVLLTGIGLVWLGDYPFFETFWTWGGLTLFLLSAVIFKLRVEPVQHRMLAVATATSFDAQAYAGLSREWMVSGSFATLAPFVALALMVLKPA